MKHYEVSVVTPFHNVDTDVFIAGIESMKAQTYGFEDIKWIVVAHNCTPEHKKEVHRLLDGYPNVILKELDNERRTPSSPRNYGLSFATGDYVGFLTASKSISLEERYTIRDILAPYINKTTMMEPSKVYSHKVVKESYDIPRNVILHPEELLKNKEDALLLSDNEAVNVVNCDNAKTLARILEANQHTDMGRHYAFRDIQTVDTFRDTLPLSDYSDLEPLLKLTTRIGESNIFTEEEITSYIEEETGEDTYRIFPLTKRHAKGNARAFSHMLEGHRTILLPDKVMGGARKYNDAVYANTTAGAVTAALFSHSAGIVPPSVTSPEALFFVQEEYDTRYLHLLFALHDREADQLVQPKCRWTLHVFSYIEEHWKTICDDIENGTVSMGEPLPDSLKILAGKYHLPDPGRAAELRNVFEEGFDTPAAKRIWPNLCFVYTNRGRDEEAYEKLKTRYLGDEVFCGDMYFETSGTVIGRASSEDHGYSLRLLNQVAFFEFIPEEEMKKGGSDIKTKLMHETELGYYKVPLDRQSIDMEGWLHTGNLGFINDEGYLVLSGRLKELIIRGGENIMPGEVEEAVSQLGIIDNVKVIGIPSDFFGEEVGACIKLKEGAEFDEEAVKNELSKSLSKFKIPSRYFIYEDFPMLGTGKIDAVSLKADVLKRMQEV